MRLAFGVTFAVALCAALYASLDLQAVALWAAEHQRGFQNQMAAAIRALRAGDPGATVALMAAAGAYGFVHAVGPGHGKYLIGGAGMGTSVPASRLLVLATLSSLAQALWAIVLVYGGFTLLEVSAQQLTSLAEEILAPLSYSAVALIGALLVWRGAKALRVRAVQEPAPAGHHHHHDHDHGDQACGCGHAHGPSPDQVAQLRSLHEAAALVASIAIRPCTGAIFLLVIAWQMDIQTAGAAAVLVMWVGTAGLTSLVAISSVAARGMAMASLHAAAAQSVVMPALQIAAGLVVIWISLALVQAAL